METPQINSSLIYSTIADLMPQEGKDFKLDTLYADNNKPKLVITPMSPIGRAWVPFLQERLAKPMSDAGFDITEGGVAAAEIETVNTIRRHIETEAAEALKAKIKSAEDTEKRKIALSTSLRKDQVAAEGADARPNKAVIDAGRAANTAARDKQRLSRISELVPKIRETVDKEAVAEAEKDAKSGRIWAVDMDAPLTSLFDRQDVRQKFKEKEEMIHQIAEYQVRMEEINRACVSTAKQYIIQKEG